MTLRKDESNDEPQVCHMCGRTIRAYEGMSVIDNEEQYWIDTRCASRTEVSYESQCVDQYYIPAI